MRKTLSVIVVGFLLSLISPEIRGEEPIFTEAASLTGLDFSHYNGMNGNLSTTEIMGGGVALFDYDNDGDLDVYLTQGNVMTGVADATKTTFPVSQDFPLMDRLYRNLLTDKGKLLFEDVTEASGIRQKGYGMGVASGDFDGDGWVDLFITNYGENALLRNGGDGTFTEVSKDAGIADARWNASASFLDFDADGKLDLFVTAYLDHSVADPKVCHDIRGKRDYCGPMAYPPLADRLYRNRGNGAFEDVSRKSGLSELPGAGLGAAVADFNGDGRLDIYVTNDQTPNRLWLNQGKGKFLDDALLAGCSVNLDGRAESSMGVTAGDVDGDGDLDLLATHLGGETDTLYLNDGGDGFLDATLRSGLAFPSGPTTSFGTAFFDFDRDGDLDLITVNGAMKRKWELVEAGDPFPFHEPNQLYRNLGKGHFEEVSSKEAGSPFELSELSLGAAVGGGDNDGDVDVFVTNNNGPVRLLLNTGKDGNHWVGLRAVAGKPSRDQLGVRLEVMRSGATPLFRHVHTDGSYLSSRDPRVLVGLGQSREPVKVRVKWVDGAQEEFGGLEVDRYHTLEKGKGRPFGAKISTLPRPPLGELSSTAERQVKAHQALVAQRQGQSGTDRESIVENLQKLAFLYHTYSFSSAALEVYEEVLRWQPDHFRALYFGGVLAFHGDPSRAERWLEEAGKIRPDYLPISIKRGELLIQRGQFAEARELLGEVVKEKPEAAAAHSLLGQIHLSHGEAQGAANRFEKVLALQPQATKTFYSLASAYRMLGRREEARDLLGRPGRGSIILLDPEMEILETLNLSSRYHLDRCTDELEVQRPREAMKACLRSLDLNEDNPTTRINLGVAMARAGLVDAAMAEYREALRIDPTSATAEFSLGALLARVNRFAAAEVHYRRSLDLDPEGGAVHLNLANTLRAQRRCGEAVAHYLKAANRLSPREGALAGAAQCRAILGECREALETLESVRDSEDLRVVDSLARILAACDDDSVRDGPRALRLAEKAFAAEPSSYHAATLAMAHAEVGDYVAASEWQRRAIGERETGDSREELYEKQLQAYGKHRPWRNPWV